MNQCKIRKIAYDITTRLRVFLMISENRRVFAKFVQKVLVVLNQFLRGQNHLKIHRLKCKRFYFLLFYSLSLDRIIPYRLRYDRINVNPEIMRLVPSINVSIIVSLFHTFLHNIPMPPFFLIFYPSVEFLHIECKFLRFLLLRRQFVIDFIYELLNFFVVL